MTYKEILAQEDANVDRIILHKEGIFLKAYNQSAYLFHTYVKDFRLKRKFVKTVNRWVVSLGFPESSSKKWLFPYPVEQLDSETLVCLVGKRVEEVAYDNWLEAAMVETELADQYTVHTSMIERQPVYKTAYDLLVQVYGLSDKVARNLRYPLMVHLKDMVYRLCYGIRILYDVPDRARHLDALLPLCTEIMYALQVLCDLKDGIPRNSYALASERIVSVNNQLEGLRRKASVPAEAEEGSRNSKLIQQPTVSREGDEILLFPPDQ